MRTLVLILAALLALPPVSAAHDGHRGRGKDENRRGSYGAVALAQKWDGDIRFGMSWGPDPWIARIQARSQCVGWLGLGEYCRVVGSSRQPCAAVARAERGRGWGVGWGRNPSRASLMALRNCDAYGYRFCYVEYSQCEEDDIFHYPPGGRY